MSGFFRLQPATAGVIQGVPLLLEVDGNFADGADWTPAAGEVKIAKAGLGGIDIAVLPTFVADNGWSFPVSAAELTGAKEVKITIIVPGIIRDQKITIDLNSGYINGL